jgi:hypothetical protein
MRNSLTPVSKITRVACALALVCASFVLYAPAQSGRQASDKKNAAAPVPPPLKRTTTRREVRRLGYGSSITLYGAPEGSITIEAWERSEIEITADIEQSANTEEELAQLTAINNFILDEDMNHLRINTVGVHDRKYLKRVARDLPKNLLTMPWKIDYHLRVPAMVDLEIYAGRGAVGVSGVEGALRLSGGEGASSFTLAGGDVEATLKGGPVTVRVPTRNWRGRGMSVRVASGDLSVELPAGFSGDINANVLRVGRIENAHPNLAPRERTQPTDHKLEGRAGAGGAVLSFTVGDGTINIKQVSSKQ